MAKKATTEAPPRSRRPRQQQIPGTEPPSIKEIDDAAEQYVDRRDMRMSLGKEESEAAEKLQALMKANNLSFYEYEGNIVTLDSVTKVKVKKKKAPGDDEQE